MFQSDDFDDNLSDESFSIIDKDILKTMTQVETNNTKKTSSTKCQNPSKNVHVNGQENIKMLPHMPVTNIVNYSFDNYSKATDQSNSNPNKNKRKRKFPGPAGLLPDSSLNLTLRNSIQSSQSFSSQTQLASSMFKEAPWLGMKEDLKSLKHSSLCGTALCTIDFVKTQAGSYRLAGRRVPLLAGIIQSIDRSIQDPSIVLHDETADIQCTLHHSAWELLKCYLVPQCTVMLLQNTTVLTTGIAVKKNYLNITLNNIIAIYCNSSYTESNKVLKIDELSSNRKYSVEYLDITDEKITIIRNTSLPKIEDNVLKGPPFAKIPIHAEAANNKLIVDSMFEGMNTDVLFDDFD